MIWQQSINNVNVSMMKKLLGIIIIFLCYSLPGFAKDIFAKCVYIGSSSANFELIEFKINTNDKSLFSSVIWKFPGKKKRKIPRVSKY